LHTVDVLPKCFGVKLHFFLFEWPLLQEILKWAFMNFNVLGSLRMVGKWHQL